MRTSELGGVLAELAARLPEDRLGWLRRADERGQAELAVEVLTGHLVRFRTEVTPAEADRLRALRARLDLAAEPAAGLIVVTGRTPRRAPDDGYLGVAEP